MKLNDIKITELRKVATLVPLDVEQRASKLSQQLPVCNGALYICIGYRLALEDMQKKTPTEILEMIGQYVHE